MMQKAFWTFLQLIVLSLLIGALPLGYLLNHSFVGWLVFLATLLLHISELLVTIPLAKQRKIPVGIAVLKTLFLGFTWWVPFKQGLLQG
jgi:hypothetical protein